MDSEPEALEDTTCSELAAKLDAMQGPNVAPAPVDDDLTTRLAAKREQYQLSLNEVTASIQQQQILAERLRGAVAAINEVLTPEEETTGG